MEPKRILKVMNFIVASVFIFVVVFGIYSLISINNRIEKFESKIGNSAVIGKDTFVIVNYSYFDQAYILSNGALASMRYVDSLNQK